MTTPTTHSNGRRSRRHVGISDVAREAGVDPSTVSRVLNGHPRVSPRTRARVESAVRALGYRPNRTARYLATQRSMTIGVLLPEMRSLMHADFLLGAQRAAHECGYSLMICDGQMDPAVQAAELERFIELRVDAVMVTRSFTMTALLAPFDELGVPVEPREVLQPSAPSTWRGRRAGSLEAFEDVLDRGHTRLAMFVRERADAPGRSPEMRSRVWSAQAAVRRRRSASTALQVVAVEGRVDAPDAYDQALARLYAGPDAPTVLIAGNDSVAAPLLGAIGRLGLDIPGDVSFLMYGDSQWAAAYRPPISVIRYDYEAEGRTLARRVLRRLGVVHGSGEADMPLGVTEGETDSLAPDVYVRRASIEPPR